MTTTVMANSSDSWTSRPTTTNHTRKVSAPPRSATNTSQKGAVREPLRGRLRVLRLLHEFDDLRQGCVGPDGDRAGAHLRDIVTFPGTPLLGQRAHGAKGLLARLRVAHEPVTGNPITLTRYREAPQPKRV